MNRSQSLNAPPYFDGSNYAFWKVHMKAFICSIDESVWDSVENEYVRPTTTKSEWDKAALALANANSKAINAIFCGVSTDEFHRISHVKTVKEAWTILETTYEGTKKKKDGKDSQSPQGVVCFECNDHGHIKKECPNYLKGKGKVFATTLSDSESSNSDMEEECDSDGNYRAFVTITSVKSKDDLSNLVNERGEHSEGEEVEKSEDEDVCQNEGENNLQEAYDSLLEDCGKYAKVANHVVRKMKKIEEEHKCTLVQLKETKCEAERLKGELIEAYSKIKFLELKIIQANVKVERISTKKLDSVLSSQKSSHDKTDLGYTSEGSSSSEPKKEVRFVSAKSIKKLKEVTTKTETRVAEKRTIGVKPKDKGKSSSKN
ncbi:hypothetical protein ACB092_12G146200 [Castanea dentata]